MLLARALFPAMVERGAGALVFVASLSGKAASPRTAIYNATKFGLRGFAFGLRTDLAPRGVGVSVVSPGFVRDAGMFADSGAKTPPGIGTRPRARSPPPWSRRSAEPGRDRRRAAGLPRARPLRPDQPGDLGPRAERAVGQKAAEEVADGHAEDKPHEPAKHASDPPRYPPTWKEQDEQRFLRRPFDPRGRAGAPTRSSASTPCRSASTSPACPTRSRSCWRTCCGSRTASRSRADDVEAIAGWDATAEPSVEIPFQPARVLMQDFTGVPAVVDLAAMRDAMDEIGGDPAAINPLVDVDLVIDHSVQVDAFGNERAFALNAEREFERNRERYSFLKWGQERLRQLPRRAAGDRDLPPGQPRAPRPGRLQPRERRHRCRPTPTPWSAPTRTRRWSTASACSAGASAGSRPRRRCSASRSRCCCRRSSASSSPASCRRGRPRPTSSSPSPRCCASAASSPSSSSSTARGCRRSGSPTGRRSATCRPSSARPARSSRSTPRRSATWS